MSIRHKIGRITGSLKAPQLVLTVWDDASAALDELDVVTYASTVAPVTVFNCLQVDDPGVEELAGHIYRVTVRYSVPELQPADAPPQREQGTLARRMHFQAQSKTMRHCLEPVGVYSPDGDVTDNYPNVKWLMNVEGKGLEASRVQGLTIDPLPETRTLDYYAPNLIITSAYLDVLEALCGAFNFAAFQGREAGSVQLVRVDLSERSPDDWEISMGFGYRAPQENLAVCKDVTLPLLRGCDAFWTRCSEILTDYGGDVGEVLEPRVDFAVVQRVWELADFSALDLPEVTYQESEP